MLVKMMLCECFYACEWRCGLNGNSGVGFGHCDELCWCDDDLVYVYHLSWSHIHLHKRRGLLAIATWPFGKSEVGIKPWPWWQSNESVPHNICIVESHMLVMFISALCDNCCYVTVYDVRWYFAMMRWIVMFYDGLMKC